MDSYTEMMEHLKIEGEELKKFHQKRKMFTPIYKVGLILLALSLIYLFASSLFFPSWPAFISTIFSFSATILMVFNLLTMKKQRRKRLYAHTSEMLKGPLGALPASSLKFSIRDYPEDSKSSFKDDYKRGSFLVWPYFVSKDEKVVETFISLCESSAETIAGAFETARLMEEEN